LVEGEGRRAAIEHVSALDGARGLAVSGVLLFHGGHLKGGYLGVDLFFTLSGFLITSLLLAEASRTGSVGLGGFWARRARRLLPALAVLMVGVALYSVAFAKPSELAQIRGDAFATLGYVANWHQIFASQSYFALFSAPSPLNHTWSLAIEEQFYVIWPLLFVALLARFRRVAPRAVLVTSLVLAGVSSVLMIVLYDPANTNRAYLGTDTRAAAILFGAALAAWFAIHGPVRSRIARVAVETAGLGGAVVLAVAWTRLDGQSATLYRGGFVLCGLAATAVLAAAVHPRPGVLSRALSFRPFCALGLISYGVYLYHWPIDIVLDEQRVGLSGWPLFAVQTAVTLAIAIASYLIVEQPIRHGKPTAARVRWLTPAVAIGLVLALFAGTLGARQIAPLTSPGVLAAALRDRPPASPPLRVMVVGDSTGTSVARGLAAAHDPRLVVDDATQPDCPIIDAAFTRLRRDDRPRDTSGCTDRTRRWTEHAKQFRPNLVLVVSSLEDAGDHAHQPSGFWASVALLDSYLATVKEYQQAARALRATGAVVAWADVPYYTFVGHPSVRAREYLDARVQLLNAAIAEVTPSQLGVVTLDFASHLDRPDGSIDLELRPDGIHLSPLAAVRSTRAWLHHELVLAYADAEREIGASVSATTAARVLVTGDSTSLPIAAGLGNHGRLHGDVVVDWAGQIACPLVHANRLRNFADGRDVPVSGCKSFPTLWEQHVRAFRPDVVLFVSSLIDVSDLNFGNGWEHIGQQRYDDRYRAAMTGAIDSFRKAGVIVLWASAPKAQLPTAAATRTLDQRLQRLNEIITATAPTRGAREIPFAAHIDTANGKVDLRERPDGVHFTVEAATRMADEWLAAEIVTATNGG
jgi:peptidoglycan/LPS O-acetylase OafA/YrhL/lysophospholipase L1-like esterase